jgi:hypothetical protein
MKTKRIALGIKNFYDTLREAGETFEKAAAGKSIRYKL